MFLIDNFENFKKQYDINIWGRISIKGKHKFNFFFSNGNFPSRICSDFFRTALFLEKLLLHSKQLTRAATLLFFRVTASTQLHFWSSYFIRAATCQNSHFFTAVFFPKYQLFQSKTPTKMLLLDSLK